MGLNTRALQNAGLIPHTIPAYTHAQDRNPHQELADILRSKNPFAEGETEEDKAYYKELNETLMTDTLHRATGVICTCSAAAENKLSKSFKPRITIWEEAGQANELEAVVGWANNCQTVEKCILVGDHFQLPPTLVTKSLNTQDITVNPFADQMEMSLFERLWGNGHKTILFTEQHRMAKGLKDIVNILVYQGRITDAPSTAIANRPLAQVGIEYIQKRHNVHDGIPHLCLHVPDGVCIKSDQTQSRYNLHNIVAVMHELRNILHQGLFKARQITITTPYREQADKYRDAFAEARKLDFWKTHKLHKVDVFTVDSFQGGQNKLVFFDTVLAKARLGGWGFVKELPRLNVALSRPEDMFVIVFNLNALDKDEGHDLDRDADEIAERAEEEKRLTKNLRTVYDYYIKQGVVRLVKPQQFEEKTLVNMSDADDYLFRIRCVKAKKRGIIICNRCRQEGHAANDCDTPDPNVVCRRCNDKGHKAMECPDRGKPTKPCFRCGEMGHFRAFCPNRPPLTCARCNEVGHFAADCTNEDKRQCRQCGQVGHAKAECPKKHLKKLKLTLPYGATDEADEADDGPTDASGEEKKGDPAPKDPASGEEKKADPVPKGSASGEEKKDEPTTETTDLVTRLSSTRGDEGSQAGNGAEHEVSDNDEDGSEDDYAIEFTAARYGNSSDW